MSQPMYTVLATSNAYANAGSQAERAFNRGYGNDAFITSTGGETANISPSTASQFTSTGDQTAIYMVGRRLRILHGGASTDTTYCEVSSASFGAGVTTVTIRNITSGATNLSTSAIAEVGVSPIWYSTGTGNHPISTGTPSFPSQPAGPYGNLGMYASSSTIIGFAVAGATHVTIGSSYLAVGALTATTGFLRIPALYGLYSRNSADTQNRSLIYLDTNDNCIVGDPSNAAIVINPNAPFRVGTTPALTGNIGLPSAGTVYQRNAANNADDQLLPLQTQESALAGNIVNIANTTAGTTVVAVVLPPGTWAISAQAQVASNSGVAKQIVGYISDGTTVEASAEIEATASNLQQVLPIPMGLITNATTSNSTYALRVYGSSSGVTVFAAVPLTGVGNNATRITAIRTGQ